MLVSEVNMKIWGDDTTDNEEEDEDEDDAGEDESDSNEEEEQPEEETRKHSKEDIIEPNPKRNETTQMKGKKRPLSRFVVCAQ